MDVAAPLSDEKPIAPQRWRFVYLISAWLVGILLQIGGLPCLCAIGSWRLEIAAWFDAMILIRMIVAYWRRETGLAWTVYAALCLTSFLWLRWLTDLILQAAGRSPC